MQGISTKTQRKRASHVPYVSPNQLTICGFETPFENQLTRTNRWVLLSKLIPWDKIVKLYDDQFSSKEGRPPINGRTVIGTVIIKHMLNLTDREVIHQICENMFMQYFIGHSTFTNEAPFDASLLVDIRKRLSLEITTSIIEIIMVHHFEEPIKEPIASTDIDLPPPDNNGIPTEETKPVEESKENKGRLLMDATAAPQNITYPTDLKLLNASRIKTEELIDKLYDKDLHGEVKPRTYRNEARKEFLLTAKKKAKSKKTIYKANGKQLRYVKRNLGHIDSMISAYEKAGIKLPLNDKSLEYLATIKLVYEQQYEMHSTSTRSIPNRIVNIHQAHVRPIVRGKEGKKVEFGSKLQVSMVNGFAFIDKLSWDNFNEGTTLKESIRLYKERFGYYPKEVLADQIYCNRENRKYLKELKIDLKAKPLGRPSKNEALSNQVSPGERNPIEGKFGQAKVAYGLENIKAKLKNTSESWIGSIVLVLNLVNLMRLAPLCLYNKIQIIIYRLFGDCKLNCVNG